MAMGKSFLFGSYQKPMQEGVAGMLGADDGDDRSASRKV